MFDTAPDVPWPTTPDLYEVLPHDIIYPDVEDSDEI